MLVSHIIKAVLSVAVLGLDVAVHLKNMDGKYTVIGLGIDVGLLYVSRTLPSFPSRWVEAN